MLSFFLSLWNHFLAEFWHFSAAFRPYPDFFRFKFIWQAHSDTADTPLPGTGLYIVLCCCSAGVLCLVKWEPRSEGEQHSICLSTSYSRLHPSFNLYSKELDIGISDLHQFFLLQINMGDSAWKLRGDQRSPVWLRSVDGKKYWGELKSVTSV